MQPTAIASIPGDAVWPFGIHFSFRLFLSRSADVPSCLLISPCLQRLWYWECGCSALHWYRTRHSGGNRVAAEFCVWPIVCLLSLWAIVVTD